MTIKYYIGKRCLTVCYEQSLLVENHHYDQILEQIRNQTNPLAGSTDWTLVRRLLEQMAIQTGLDVKLACYWVAASFKTRGLAGLVESLPFLCCCLTNSDNSKLKNNALQQRSLHWLARLLTDELNVSTFNEDDLIDLFTCEKLIAQLDDIIQCEQPNYAVDFEQLAYAIYQVLESMSGLDGRKEVQVQMALKPFVQYSKVTQGAWLFIASVIGAGTTLFFNWL